MAKEELAAGWKEAAPGFTEFTITVPTDQVPEIGEAFAKLYTFTADPSYPGDEAYNALDPQQQMGMKMLFTRQKVITYISEIVRSYHIQQAQEAAMANVSDNPLNIS